jgi:hypothetical protein
MALGIAISKSISNSELRSDKKQKTMKKLLVTLAAMLVSVSAFAQGTVNFNNFVPTPRLDAPIWAPGGTGTVGAGEVGAVAQLFVLQNGNWNPVGQVSNFRAGTAGNPNLDAYIVGNTSMDIGLPVRSSQTVRVRAWVGASYDTAAIRGESNDVIITLGGTFDPNSPADFPAQLTGLTAFTLVPEPSSIALGLLGAAALLYRRRK